MMKSNGHVGCAIWVCFDPLWCFKLLKLEKTGLINKGLVYFSWVRVPADNAIGHRITSV